MAKYVPSTAERVRDQVALYEATGGREGATLEDKPVVILTTTGAKTGSIRKNPIMRIERDGTYLAVASAGGSPTHPGWYYNLLATPEAELQDHDKVFKVRAREIHGEEKAQWWPVAEAHWPHFPEYREKAGGRDIPLVLLEPLDRGTRPT